MTTTGRMKEPKKRRIAHEGQQINRAVAKNNGNNRVFLPEKKWNLNFRQIEWSMA